MHAASAVRSADCIFETSSAIAGRTDLTWEAVVLATRVHDRTLALMAAVNRELQSKDELASPFSACISIGTAALRKMLVPVIARSEASGGRERMFASGPLADLVRSNTIAAHPSPYDFENPPVQGRHLLLGGIVSDALDLLQDVQIAAGMTPFINQRRQQVWTELDIGIALDDRRTWGCGHLLTRRKFLQSFNMSDQTLTELEEEGSVICLHWWDGRVVYPSIQVQDGEEPSIYPRLRDLLRIRDPSCSLWSLTMWLGERPGEYEDPYVTWLASDDGFAKLRAELATFGAVIDFESKHLQRIDEERASLAFADESNSLTIAGAQQYLTGRIIDNSTAVDPPKPIWRITRREFGPIFYSVAKDPKRAGRFDLPVDSGDGTCYFSSTPTGAISEVYGRILMIDVQDLSNRIIWKSIPVPDVTHVANLTNPDPDSALQLPTTAFTSMDRESTQALAATLRSVGFSGVVHRLKTLEGPLGYALFGPAGPSSGNGEWLFSSSQIGDNEEFWEWVQRRRRQPRVSILFMQFPYVQVLPLEKVDS